MNAIYISFPTKPFPRSGILEVMTDLGTAVYAIEENIFLVQSIPHFFVRSLD